MASKTYEQTMLGRWLRHCRGDEPQEEVAPRADMHQSEWSKWETGERRRASPAKLKIFAGALRQPVETMALAYAGLWPEDYSEFATPMAGPRDEPQLVEAAVDLVDRLDRQSRQTVQRWLEETFGVRAEAASPAPLENSDAHRRA